MQNAWAEASADVDERANLGPGTRVWHLAQIRENAQLGRGCVVGRGVYVGPGVVIGDNVKLQNYALVYEPARLEDAVFIGPAAVLTNDRYPRSTDVTGRLKRPADWDAYGVVVRTGASVGARAVIVAGVEIGRWAMVAAGAVVTRDVPEFALVAGVPARRTGWVGRAGVTLSPDGYSRWRCPETGELFTEVDGLLQMTDRNARELAPLASRTGGFLRLIFGGNSSADLVHIAGSCLLPMLANRSSWRTGVTYGTS